MRAQRVEPTASPSLESLSNASPPARSRALDAPRNPLITHPTTPSHMHAPASVQLYSQFLPVCLPVSLWAPRTESYYIPSYVHGHGMNRTKTLYYSLALAP